MKYFFLALRNVFRSKSLSIKLGFGILCISFLLMSFFSIKGCFEDRTKKMMDGNYSNNYITSIIYEDTDFINTPDYQNYVKLINSKYTKEVCYNDVMGFDFVIHESSLHLGYLQFPMDDVGEIPELEARLLDNKFPDLWIQEYEILTDNNDPIIAGRFAENTGEIMISEVLLNRIGLEADMVIDQKFAIYDNVNECYRTPELKVVGVLDSRFHAISRLVDTDYIFANVTSKEEFKSYATTSFSGIEIYLKDFNHYESAIKLIEGVNGAKYVCQKSAWLILMSQKEYGIFKSIFVVVMSLIIAMSILIILINLDTLQRKKKRYFKMMYNIGFTRRQNLIIYFIEWIIILSIFFYIGHLFVEPFLNILKDSILRDAGIDILINKRTITKYSILFYFLELIAMLGLLSIYINHTNKKMKYENLNEEDEKNINLS